MTRERRTYTNARIAADPLLRRLPATPASNDSDTSTIEVTVLPDDPALHRSRGDAARAAQWEQGYNRRRPPDGQEENTRVPKLQALGADVVRNDPYTTDEEASRPL